MVFCVCRRCPSAFLASCRTLASSPLAAFCLARRRGLLPVPRSSGAAFCGLFVSIWGELVMTSCSPLASPALCISAALRLRCSPLVATLRRCAAAAPPPHPGLLSRQRCCAPESVRATITHAI